MEKLFGIAQTFNEGTLTIRYNIYRKDDNDHIKQIGFIHQTYKRTN